MFLQDISFVRKYNNTPNVFVSANHSSNGGNRQPKHNGITAWVEVGWRQLHSTVSGNSFKMPLRRNFTFLFSPFFLPRITYRRVRCPFFQKEKFKKFSFIKISPFEK